MKLAVIASLLTVGTSAAFAPAKQAAKTTSLNAFENELGAQRPLDFFDPLNLVADGDAEKFDRLRYVEIKHGRICQLAFLGQIVTRSGTHFSGNIDYAGHSFDSYPNGIAALIGPDAIPVLGAAQIFAFIGLLEVTFMKSVPGTGNEFVGDFRNGQIDLGWDTFTEEEKLQKRGTELNNGRAAMMGILGLMVHEQLNAIGMTAELPIIGVLK
jgi:hypothetical protein